MAVVYLLSRSSNSKKISWQEFRTEYLDRGLVDRLVVVNKDEVRVYLRRDAGTTVGSSISGVRGHLDAERGGCGL